MRYLLLFVALISPVWALRLSNAVGSEMDSWESADSLSPEKYCSRQYQAISCALGRQSEKVRVMSYNMLMNKGEEKRPRQHSWDKRLPRIALLIQEDQPDIIGSQELHDQQIEDLLEEIGDTYAFFGRGTCDGDKGGEINGIFYRKARFSPVTCRVWWLSPTPGQPGPDHSLPVAKTLTMVQLYDRTTHRQFAVFNTHLSFGSPNSRDESAHRITKLIEPYAATIPVVLVGDFNTFPNRPDTTLPYYDGAWVDRILTSGSLQDAARIAVLGHLGPTSTYTNRGTDPTPFVGTGKPGVLLDHIYVSPQICVLLHATESAQVDGLFPSDHMPLIVDFVVW